MAGRVSAIREVLSYLTHHRGHLFVFRLADQLLDEPLFPLLMQDLVLLHRMGIRVVLVPGARAAIEHALGDGASQYLHGLRITRDDELPHVMLAASAVANRLLSLISANNAEAITGNWLRARTVGVVAGTDYRRTGTVERVNTSLLRKIIDEGLIPIVSNIGWNSVGDAYNLSSVEVAVRVATALGAAKLFLVGSPPGIAAETSRLAGARVRGSGVYATLDVAQAQQLRDTMAPGEQQELVAAAVLAAEGGVGRVHIVDGQHNGVLLEEVFSATGRGTMVYRNHYTDIGSPAPAEVPEIMRLIQPVVEQGLLVPRSHSQIADALTDWVVYRVDETIHGCAALVRHPGGWGELCALVVDPPHRGSGAGERLVSFLLERAASLGLVRVFALTTQASDFFAQLGFSEISVGELPEGRQGRYDTGRNSRVLAVELTGRAVSGGGRLRPSAPV